MCLMVHGQRSPCISCLIRRASISLLRDGHHQDQAYHFGKKDFELEAKTRPEILKVVLCPYVLYCPCEA